MNARLFLHIASVEARKRMSYRIDFWINTLFGFLAEFGVHFFLALALFAESGSTQIRGFAQPDLVVYFVTVLLIQKIVMGPDFGGHVSELTLRQILERPRTSTDRITAATIISTRVNPRSRSPRESDR